MSLNEVASGERVHIGFFGVRNAGKSRLVNAFTGQDLSIVSDVEGTTTDVVKKAMELLPMGPVVIIDTPGIDDEGDLGYKRVARAQRTLAMVDVAVLVVDGTRGLDDNDRMLIKSFAVRQIPYVIAWNKIDKDEAQNALLRFRESDAENASRLVAVSAKGGTGINELKERVGHLAKPEAFERRVVADLVPAGSVVVLVCPIDSAAPKGRLIMPQQLAIRDLLDGGCIPVVCREFELEATLAALKEPPALVVTDSQAFGVVSKIVPESVPLTSFSILMVRYKANLIEAVRGAAQLDKLADGDTVLVSEGCSHHRQCDDIGTVKLPHWLEEYTGKKLNFEFTSGTEFPNSPDKYALVIHCGGCMLNAREMQSRQARSIEAGVPVTNYGVAIAQMHGILRRSLTPFPEALKVLK